MRRASTAVLAVALAVSALAAALHGEAPAAGTPRGKNLQVLSPDVNLDAVMARFNAGLGVQCTYCHVADDFASDANPKKAAARTMLRMLKQVNTHFPDAGNDFLRSRFLPFPEGKQYVTCFTCHRGEAIPANRLADWHGPPRAPEPGAPAGRRGRGAPEPDDAAIESALAGGGPAVPATRGRQMHKNMVFLPMDVNTQFVMPAFRAAIGVECAFCHVTGAHLELGHANDRDNDGNPKKLIARGMIGMMKEINAALFPNDDIDIVLAAASEPPPGRHDVTCYTCHRGTHLPVTER